MTDIPAFPVAFPVVEATRLIADTGMTLHEYATIRFIAAEIARSGIEEWPDDELVARARELADAALSHRT